MALIYFNNVVYIHSPKHELDGEFRVAAVCPHKGMAGMIDLRSAEQSKKKLGPKLSYLRTLPLKLLEEIEDERNIRSIELMRKITPLQLSTASQAKYERRIEIMQEFLDHESLKRGLLYGDLYIIVRGIAKQHECSEMFVYNLLRKLCVGGFEAASLIPNFHNCGGPGQSKPWLEQSSKPGRKSDHFRETGEEEFTQRGLLQNEYAKLHELYLKLKDPKKSDHAVYLEILEMLYASKAEITDEGTKWVLPKRGTYPSYNQFSHLIRKKVPAFKKLKLSTTDGHFQANHRSLKGASWQNITGPGFVYACDSTIGDIQLRSSINRNWKIGRPTLYVVVDVWSTAVVGFHLCYEAPSWDMAKLALFCSATDPSIMASLWGSSQKIILDPDPKMFFILFGDRGEYLSEKEKRSASSIKFSEDISPPRRPDTRAVNEVKHRIIKSVQYRMLPGAMDSCRKETELKKASLKNATLTLNEYARYLISMFNHLNHAPTLKKRLTAEMIGDAVDPSPAGLWKWGHEVGIGYRYEMPFHRLVTEFLPTGTATVDKHGIKFNKLLYESEWTRKEEWSGVARNFGVKEITVYYFPGSIKQIWHPDGPNGFTTLTLSSSARANGNIPFSEWDYAQKQSNMTNRSRAADFTEQTLAFRKSTRDIVKVAKAENKIAAEFDDGDHPHFRDAQRIEIAKQNPSKEYLLPKKEDLLPKKEPRVDAADPALLVIQSILDKKMGPGAK
jgi:putative transposase